MEAMLLLASSNKWFVRASFAVFILVVVAVFGGLVEYILAVNGESVNTINVRGGIFLIGFILTLIAAAVFSRGSNYKIPAIALLLIFLVQTAAIFLVMALFHGSQFAQTTAFPFIYIGGYILFRYKDSIIYVVCTGLNAIKFIPNLSLEFARATKMSITSVLILKGLRWMAAIYVFYSLMDVFYIYFRDVDYHVVNAISKAIKEHNDFNYANTGRYLLDAVVLYFILILLAGISKSNREYKISNKEENSEIAA